MCTPLLHCKAPSQNAGRSNLTASEAFHRRTHRELAPLFPVTWSARAASWKLCCVANGVSTCPNWIESLNSLVWKPQGKNHGKTLSKCQQRYHKKRLFDWFKCVKGIQRALPVQHILPFPSVAKLDMLLQQLVRSYTVAMNKKFSKGYPSAMFRLLQGSDPNFQRSCSVLLQLSNLILLSGHRCLFTKEKQLG